MISLSSLINITPYCAYDFIIKYIGNNCSENNFGENIRRHVFFTHLTGRYKL